MQIRYETTKLTMHPTNNRGSPECRRHGFGENTEEGSDAENTDCGNREGIKSWCLGYLA